MGSQVDGSKPSDPGHGRVRFDDSADEDVLEAMRILESSDTSDQASIFDKTAANATGSAGYGGIVQRDDSGTSEIVDYAAVIDDFSQTVPDLEP